MIMSRPSYSVNNATFKMDIPVGWYSSISSISRVRYQHIFNVTHSLLPRSRDIFENKGSDRTMTNLRTGSTSFVTEEKRDPSSITLAFYYSKVKVPPSRLESDLDPARGLEVVPFSRLGILKSIPDYQIYTIFVAHALDPGTGARYADVVVTIYCTKGVEPPKLSKKAPRHRLFNIQADIVPGLTKSIEYFYFFQIANIPAFRRGVKEYVLPRVTTAEQIMTARVRPPGLPIPGEPFVGLSIGFSSTGLKTLGLVDSLHDTAFEKGQLRDAKELGDSGTERSGIFYPDWDVEFKADIHGVFQITAHDEDVVTKFINNLDAAFRVPPRRSAIRKILLLRASFRPPPETLNEHFGYRDGISKPEVEGVTFDRETKPMRFPGSPVVDLGVIVMGYDGDEDKDVRPQWAIDGSFLVFRKLRCFVPEFDDFLAQEGPKIFPNILPKAAAARLGARLFGRWKNGTPVVLSPERDDPKIAADNNLLNNFDYPLGDQSTCPFAAHTRKSFPRGDLADSKRHLFRRASITYGPELHDDEKDGTIDDRGLIFLCYQSSIVRGFKFIQQNFNNVNFPPSRGVDPGYDPILGETGHEKRNIHRYTSGINPSSPGHKLTFPVQFIQADGGEYFFLPSISTLTSKIAS